MVYSKDRSRDILGSGSGPRGGCPCADSLRRPSWFILRRGSAPGLRSAAPGRRRDHRRGYSAAACGQPIVAMRGRSRRLDSYVVRDRSSSDSAPGGPARATLRETGSRTPSSAPMVRALPTESEVASRRDPAEAARPRRWKKPGSGQDPAGAESGPGCQWSARSRRPPRQCCNSSPSL